MVSRWQVKDLQVQLFDFLKPDREQLNLYKKGVSGFEAAAARTDQAALREQEQALQRVSWNRFFCSIYKFFHQHLGQSDNLDACPDHRPAERDQLPSRLWKLRTNNHSSELSSQIYHKY